MWKFNLIVGIVTVIAVTMTASLLLDPTVALSADDRFYITALTATNVVFGAVNFWMAYVLYRDSRP